MAKIKRGMKSRKHSKRDGMATVKRFKSIEDAAAAERALHRAGIWFKGDFGNDRGIDTLNVRVRRDDVEKAKKVLKGVGA